MARRGSRCLGILCITLAELWYADRDGLQGAFLQPIAPLLARKATPQTARARATTDRRELCRGSLALWQRDCVRARRAPDTPCVKQFMPPAHVIRAQAATVLIAPIFTARAYRHDGRPGSATPGARKPSERRMPMPEAPSSRSEPRRGVGSRRSGVTDLSDGERLSSVGLRLSVG